MDPGRDAAVLAEAGMNQLREWRGVLRRAGIEAHILRPPTARNT